MTLDLEDGDDLRSEINVTPLVDVMLVLLVIFMVVTPLLRQQLPIELPVAAQGEEQRTPDQVTLRAAADGTLMLNDERTDDAGLRDALERLYSTRGDRTIFLEADRTLPYSRVVDLMDACRAAGIVRIGVVTRQHGG
jgi:biopolymer transport protein ExbD